MNNDNYTTATSKPQPDSTTNRVANPKDQVHKDYVKKMAELLNQECDLERRMDDAWDTFDLLNDQYYEQLADYRVHKSVTFGMVMRAERRAVKAQQKYYRFIADSYECECHPYSSIVCRVCKARKQAKETYRIKESK